MEHRMAAIALAVEVDRKRKINYRKEESRPEARLNKITRLLKLHRKINTNRLLNDTPRGTLPVKIIYLAVFTENLTGGPSRTLSSRDESFN